MSAAEARFDEAQRAISEPETTDTGETTRERHLEVVNPDDVIDPAPASPEPEAEPVVVVEPDGTSPGDAAAAGDWKSRAARAVNAARSHGAGVGEFIAPPTGIFTEPRPSAADTWARARRGQQVADHGFLRAAGTVYSAIATGYRGYNEVKSTISDRPSWLLVVSIVLGLAAAYEPTRQVLIWMLWLPNAAHDWLAALPD